MTITGNIDRVEEIDRRIGDLDGRGIEVKVLHDDGGKVIVRRGADV